MTGTKKGGLKTAKTIKERYGKDFYREMGRKGGRNGNTGGFFDNPELAKKAGRKGGLVSSRAKNKKSYRARRARAERILATEEL